MSNKGRGQPGISPEEVQAAEEAFNQLGKIHNVYNYALEPDFIYRSGGLWDISGGKWRRRSDGACVRF